MGRWTCLAPISLIVIKKCFLSVTTAQWCEPQFRELGLKEGDGLMDEHQNTACPDIFNCNKKVQNRCCNCSLQWCEPQFRELDLKAGDRLMDEHQNTAPHLLTPYLELK